jgi:hypothetical protein
VIYNAKKFLWLTILDSGKYKGMVIASGMLCHILGEGRRVIASWQERPLRKLFINYNPLFARRVPMRIAIIHS